MIRDVVLSSGILDYINSGGKWIKVLEAKFLSFEDFFHWCLNVNKILSRDFCSLFLLLFRPPKGDGPLKLPTFVFSFCAKNIASQGDETYRGKDFNFGGWVGVGWGDDILQKLHISPSSQVYIFPH